MKTSRLAHFHDELLKGLEIGVEMRNYESGYILKDHRSANDYNIAALAGFYRGMSLDAVAQ